VSTAEQKPARLTATAMARRRWRRQQQRRRRRMTRQRPTNEKYRPAGSKCGAEQRIVPTTSMHPYTCAPSAPDVLREGYRHTSPLWQRSMQQRRRAAAGPAQGRCCTPASSPATGGLHPPSHTPSPPQTRTRLNVCMHDTNRHESTERTSWSFPVSSAAPPSPTSKRKDAKREDGHANSTGANQTPGPVEASEAGGRPYRV
jgi:hypothetical protein